MARLRVKSRKPGVELDGVKVGGVDKWFVV